LAELKAYAPLVSLGSYCVVFDTMVEDLPLGTVRDREWDKGRNPKTAIWEYLSQLMNVPSNAVDGAPLKFSIDKEIDYKILISYAPDGYLKRVQ
jgi:cephalosporin hydroxylase